MAVGSLQLSVGRQGAVQVRDVSCKAEPAPKNPESKPAERTAESVTDARFRNLG
jgi:hypothetical protein